jgi:hypothetical protein
MHSYIRRVDRQQGRELTDRSPHTSAVAGVIGGPADSTGRTQPNTEAPPPITNIERLAKGEGLERFGTIAVAPACVGLLAFGVASAPGPAPKPEPKAPAIPRSWGPEGAANLHWASGPEPRRCHKLSTGALLAPAR